MFYRRFVFGKVPSETGAKSGTGLGDCPETGTEDAATVRVRAGDLYDPDRGYGFVTEKNRREQERLRVPELNSAFDAACWYQNQELTLVEEDRFGCFLDSDGGSPVSRRGRERLLRESIGGFLFPLNWMCPVRGITR